MVPREPVTAESEGISMLIFLVNPNAGGERGYRVFKKLERRLLRTKTAYQVYVTGGPGEARQLAARLSAEYEGESLTLVAVGGDGMLNEVLNGARLSERLRFGFIPVGRDSDFARGLRLPRTPLGCLKRILSPREERELDYGVAEFGGDEPSHHRFLVSCGMGFDAEWLAKLYELEQRRGRRSRLIWRGLRLLVGFRSLLRARCTRGYFETDSGQRVEFGHLFLLSAQLYATEAGGIRLANKVPPTDGLLTVAVLNTHSRLQQARLLLLPRRKAPESYAGVRVYRCREFRLFLDEALPLHADGEGLGGRKELTLRCVRRRIRFLC